MSKFTDFLKNHKKLAANVLGGLFVVGGGIGGAAAVNAYYEKNHDEFQKKIDQMTKENMEEYYKEMQEMMDELLANSKDTASKNELDKINSQFTALIESKISDKDNPNAKELIELFDEIESLKEDCQSNSKLTPEDKKSVDSYINGALKELCKVSLEKSSELTFNAQYVKGVGKGENLNSVEYYDLSNKEGFQVIDEYGYNSKSASIISKDGVVFASKTDEDYTVDTKNDKEYIDDMMYTMDNLDDSFVEYMTADFDNSDAEISTTYNDGQYSIVRNYEEENRVVETIVRVDETTGQLEGYKVLINGELFDRDVEFQDCDKAEYEQAKSQVLNMIEQAKENLKDPSYEDTMWK